jgi:lipopolysaccharide biosynthesis glycosyltransferase
MLIHLAIAFDQNYLNPFFALLASIFEHHTKGEIKIHAIATGIDNETRNEIARFVVSCGGEIEYYSISSFSPNELITMSTWTSAVYYRLYFPLLVSACVGRILYIDTDTLVVNNLVELYNLPLAGYPVGAVYDNYVRTQPLLGITKEGEYFNSGVLLIDIEKWRNLRISEKTIEYLLAFPERIRYVDQCGLNAILINSWKKLDPKFNVLYSAIPEHISDKELTEFTRGKVILHFTLQRPWQMLCKNRYRALYFKYLKKSGLRKGKIIVDFSYGKIYDWLKIRIKEFYHDHLFIKKAWKVIKGIS